MKVLGVVTLVDREEGGRENIEKEGYWLKSIFTKARCVLLSMDSSFDRVFKGVADQVPLPFFLC